MWINFVRLTDRALHTHEQARRHLNSYRGAAHTGRVGPYFLAIDELEACITATVRAVLNAERIDATGAHRQLLRATPKQPSLFAFVATTSSTWTTSSPGVR
jgi:hypothetical protein